MTQNVLIVGATSGIAEAVARRYAERGARLFLAARNPDKLATIAADLRARGATAADVLVVDATDSAQLTAMTDAAWHVMGSVHVALVAYGSLPDATRTETDTSYLTQEFRLNAESTLVCLTALAQRLQTQGTGVLAVIGSVAGDRGRASNYLYGAAKAAVHTFASGLRARLARSGVQVLTIKPGFVATQMTAHLKLPPALTADPASVAKRIQQAIDRKRDVVYVPGFWWLIMTIIRLLPEPIFKRLKM